MKHKDQYYLCSIKRYLRTGFEITLRIISVRHSRMAHQLSAAHDRDFSMLSLYAAAAMANLPLAKVKSVIAVDYFNN
ncbi:hypothetical protein DC094_14570 [Pelagibaculum spongiae]|uniref:Uncharacterized protein n=1 Tax=Pelagibaculum spongiae TaxID=2080658 RepID=A0A2V1GRE7_9GAMM|nr:hypothetical protein DC094_14570 [Pelagibaculum spongiae]